MQCEIEGCRRNVSPQHKDLGLCQICRLKTKSFKEILNEEISEDGYSVKLARYISLNISEEHYELLIEKILSQSVSEGNRNYYLTNMCQTIQSESLTVLLLEQLDLNLNNPQIFDAICSSLSYRFLSNENMKKIELIILKSLGIDEENSNLRSICRIYDRDQIPRNVSLLIDFVQVLRFDYGPNEIVSTILRHIEWDKIRGFLDIEIRYVDDERRPKTIRNMFNHRLEQYLPILFQRFPDQDWSSFWDLNGIDINSIHTLRSEQFADIIAKSWGANAEWGNDKGEHPHEANYLKLDCSKAKNILKWKPIWTLDQALFETVKWYKAFYNNENMSIFTLKQIEKYILHETTL